MRFSQTVCAVALLITVVNAATSTTGTTLSADAIQKGSFVDGSKEVGAAEVGQALSLTSTNNFINNCVGKTLTNGLQITTGSCNGITMGDIPAKTNMVSSVITFPTTGGKDIVADTDFNITVQMSNLVAGSFTNADATYYAAPQALQGGLVVGHTHVTVQDMGNSLNPTKALDATQFAFFKGINDAGDGQGLLTAAVTGGLPAGNYRVCTMASASNHQPVLMPVAQRGTADDCTKFVVSGKGTTENDAANDGAKGIAAAAAAASAVANGAGVDDPALTAATSATKAANDKTAAAAKATTTSKKGSKAVVADTSSVAASVETTTSKKGSKAVTTKASSVAASVEAVETTTSKKGGKAAVETSASKEAATTTSATAKSTVQAQSGNNGKGGFGNGQNFGGGNNFGGKSGRKLRARRQFVA